MNFLSGLLASIVQKLLGNLASWAVKKWGDWQESRKQKKKKKERHSKIDAQVKLVEELSKQIKVLKKQDKPIPPDLLKRFQDASNELNSSR